MDSFGLVGQTVAGRFRIEGFSRDDATWIVYRARDSSGGAVALQCLKVIDPGFVARLNQRFADELPALQRLTQRTNGICPMLGSGLVRAAGTPHPILFTAFEWLDGVTLEEDFRQRRLHAGRPGEADKGRTWGEIFALFGSAAEGLAQAHASGMVHHDIRPQTLFLQSVPNATHMRVLDFGVARVLEQETGADEVQTRAMSAAPHYTAPERFDARFGPLGPWTDVYAFALVMVEAAYGERARKGRGYADVALEVLERRRVPTPRTLGMSVPDSLEELFASALALEARARPRDMADLWSRFESVLAIRKGPAEDASPNTRPRPAEGSETRHLSPSVMPAQVRDFLATGAPSPGAAGVPVDDDRTVMAAPPEAPDSSPTIALERPEPHPAHASHAAHAPYAQAAAPGPRAPYVAPPSHGGESSVIVLEPDPSEIVDRTLTLADRDKAAVAPAQRIVHAPPPPPPARAQVQQPPPAPPPHWVPPPPAPAMAPPMAPIAPMASPMGQGPTNTMQSRPGPPMQHAPPIMVQQYVPPPPPSAQPQQASATSTRTLLWVVVILLVVAVLGVGAVTLLVLAKR